MHSSDAIGLANKPMPLHGIGPDQALVLEVHTRVQSARTSPALNKSRGTPLRTMSYKTQIKITSLSLPPASC